MVFSAVLIQRIQEEIGVKRNHGGSISRIVGKQAPILRRCAEVSELASLGKIPFTVCFRLGLGLALDQLFSSLAEQFRHGQVKLHGRSFNLLISRVGQLHFGFFHAGNLPGR